MTDMSKPLANLLKDRYVNEWYDHAEHSLYNRPFHCHDLTLIFIDALSAVHQHARDPSEESLSALKKAVDEMNGAFTENDSRFESLSDVVHQRNHDDD